MLIDWFTVAAQAINFLILVWLLKRFLYQRVLDAMEAREQHITASLKQAAERKAEADQALNDYRQKNEEFDRGHHEALQRVTAEANAERDRLLAGVRKEIAEVKDRWHRALEVEQQASRRELAAAVQSEVLEICRRVMADLGAASLDERIAAVFVQRLHGLDAEAKAQFAPLRDHDAGLVVRSAIELSLASRALLQQAVEDVFPGRGALRFETAPNLVGGVELSSDGEKLAWSVADYLAALEASVDEWFRREHHAHAA